MARLARRRLVLAATASFIITSSVTTAQEVAAATPVIVTGVSTSSVAVEGVTTIAVTGSGFGVPGGTATALCRITSRNCGKPSWDPTGGYCTGDFTYNGAAGHEENASKPPADPNWLNPGPRWWNSMRRW